MNFVGGIMKAIVAAKSFYNDNIKTTTYLSEKEQMPGGEWLLTFHDVRRRKVRSKWTVIGRRTQWRWFDSGEQVSFELRYFLFDIWVKEELKYETKSSKVINMHEWKEGRG